MSKNIYMLLMLIWCSMLLTNCASSDSSADTTAGISTEAEIRENESKNQAAMDPDINMSSEDTTDTNISANNPIGREMNIVALVQQNPNLSTFLDLIKAADMVVVLQSPAPYTVFAPTNKAFAALPAGTVEALKQPGNRLELTRLIQSHVLPNRITAAEIRDNMPLKTAQGEEVIARRNGQTVTVGGATVLTADVNASNGVVHVINKVLVPPKK